MKKTVVVLALAALLAGLGCQTAEAKGKSEEKAQKAASTVQISDDAFKSDKNGILKINNFTRFDVAIFVGRVERKNLIGAIKAGSGRDFDISKLPGIPQKGAFLFRAAAYQTLDKKGLTGLTEEDVVYTGLVAYDLSRPDRKIEKDIWAHVDDAQETFIYVSNLSKYVLELRIDSPDGEKVGVLSPGQRNKKLWVKPQEDGLPYRFFPTYIYVNPNSGDVDAFTDEVNKTGPRFEPRTAGSQVRVVEFNDPPNKPGGKQYNVSFIKLQNDTNGLISFETAQASYVKNTRGTVNTNPGDIDVYEVASIAGDAGQVYSNMGVETDSGHITFKPPVKVRPGYEYALTVTLMNGNYQYGIKELGLKSETETNKIDLYME
jgi:hypothetical protein